MPHQNKPQNCPLCEQKNTDVFSRVNQRLYFRCKRCDLIYLHSAFYLSAEDEKARYKTHNNSSEDIGYQQFLKPMFKALSPMLKESSQGLDFGCGDGSPLPKMFEAAGHKITLYDPFFYPNKACLQHQYDFVVSTETFEHFYNPKKEIQTLLSCLKPKGYLAIMTLLFKEKEYFEKSYYHRDPTHTVFYSQKCFAYIAKIHNLNAVVGTTDIVILQKK